MLSLIEHKCDYVIERCTHGEYIGTGIFVCWLGKGEKSNCAVLHLLWYREVTY